MRILFYANKLIYGGGQKVSNWLALELVKNGHEVIYATSNYNEKYKEELKIVSLYGKIKVVEYPFHLKYKRPLLYWKMIKSIYCKNNVDMIIYFGGSLVEQIIARKMGIKILLSERCDPTSRDFLPKVLKKIQYLVCDGYVFQTPNAAKFYGKRAIKKGIIIPNPIIDDLPNPILDNLRKEIVTVGRLSIEKNQLMLIDAFAEFIKIKPDYKLKIYGSGPLELYLKKHIESCKLNNYIEIIKGKLDIVNEIRGAEVFVLTSNTEGMPNALIEAMSIGLLCISTDCPIYGPRMLIENGQNGFLVPTNNVNILKETMIDSIESSEMANNIRKNALKIRERLASSMISKKWIDYIEKL